MMDGWIGVRMGSYLKFSKFVKREPVAWTTILRRTLTLPEDILTLNERGFLIRTSGW